MIRVVWFLLINMLMSFGQAVREQQDDVELEDSSQSIVSDSPYFEETFSIVGNFPVRNWNQPKIHVPESFSAQDPKLVQSIEFWKQVYTQYSSDKGIIHDAEDLSIVYKIVDFSPINARSDINKYRKQYLRERLVKKEKESIKFFLKKIKTYSNPVLSDWENQLWLKHAEAFKKRSMSSLLKNVRFQLGQKDRIISGIFYSGLYLDYFYQTFRSCQLPEVLAWIPFLESSFNPLAQSKVGASGLFQLMPSVLKSAEKKCEKCDLRNQPFVAARIACRVLRENYRILKSWPLAVTAYNHGPTGILKLIRRCQSRELVDLMDVRRCKGIRLGFASRNFWPAFLSLVEIYRHANSYYGKLIEAKPWDVEVFRVTSRSWTFEKVVDAFQNSDVAFFYNVHLRYYKNRKNQKLPVGTIVVLPQKSTWDGVVRDGFKNN